MKRSILHYDRFSLLKNEEQVYSETQYTLILDFRFLIIKSEGTFHTPPHLQRLSTILSVRRVDSHLLSVQIWTLKMNRSPQNWGSYRIFGMPSVFQTAFF